MKSEKFFPGAKFRAYTRSHRVNDYSKLLAESFTESRNYTAQMELVIALRNTSISHEERMSSGESRVAGVDPRVICTALDRRDVLARNNMSRARLTICFSTVGDARAEDDAK